MENWSTSEGVPDTSAKFGPPDKNEHFASSLDSDDDFDLPPLSKKVKEGEKDRRDVEVLYSDGFWYKGWLSSFNFNTGKWIVQFCDDNENTEVSFPDKEVRLCK